MAWFGGFKHDPWLLDFGDTSWKNVLLQLKIDENVDYQPIIKGGHQYWVAMIAFAGIGANIVLLAVSLPLLARKQSLSSLFDHSLYWFCVMNIGHIFAYVPIRTFTYHADMAHIEKALQISPWWLMIVVGIPSFMVIGYFLVNIMPKKVWIMLTTLLVIFGYFACAPLLGSYGATSEFLMHLSWYTIPLVLLTFLAQSSQASHKST